MDLFVQAEAVRREYARLAEQYDVRWGFYVEETCERTLRVLEVRPGDAVLDVGCGTGVLLKAIAQRVPSASLAGLDLSPEMLALARRKLPSNVRLVNARAERLPFGSASFDTVVSVSSLHFWYEPVEALREVARVLRPGGRVVITDWCADFFSTRALDFWSRCRHRYAAKSYRETELVTALERAGFVRIRSERFKIDWLWGLMTATACTQR